MMKFVELSPRTMIRLRSLIGMKQANVRNEAFMREIAWMVDDVCHTARSCGIFGFRCDRNVVYFYEEGEYVMSLFTISQWHLVRMFLLTMLDHESSPMEANEGIHPTAAVSSVRTSPDLRMVSADAT